MKKIRKIRLTQEPFVTNNGQDYHNYTDGEGNLTQEAVDAGVVYYTAHAVDSDGNEYDVNWGIANLDAYNSGDEDCCNWDEPDKICSYEDNAIVEAEIEW